MSASTTRTAPSLRGPRVRPELPLARVVTLEVHDLSVDPGPDGSRLHGLDLELRAGTLTVATPAAPARTLARVLVGDLPGRDGDLVTGQGRTRRRLATTSWTALAARTPPTTGRPTVEVLGQGGLAAIRLGVHLGLGPLLDRPLAVLDAADRTLVGLALALAAAPDLVVLDLPAAGLDPEGRRRVLEALRDLVDVEGRTVLVVASTDHLDADVVALVDDVVRLEPSAAERRG
ncbi:hypothetical protein [Phycicoccus sp. DTK01]|uniref:hypothetical protein n=1 Tax=Phycicoccus sp. DTK01 TaxID=2785745 RepID=UPI001A8FBD59|nr:hypothetical protein [Phycicoccus sp. DTK01]GIL36322.1 hypothetical protein PDTK01_23970 [Phycicoccus sp. DTK01]